MIEITLPEDVWQDVEPGTEALVEKWLVGEGDTVRAGQPIAEVVIVKAHQEIVAPADGRIVKIQVKAEETFGKGRFRGMVSTHGSGPQRPARSCSRDVHVGLGGAPQRRRAKP